MIGITYQEFAKIFVKRGSRGATLSIHGATLRKSLAPQIAAYCSTVDEFRTFETNSHKISKFIETVEDITDVPVQEGRYFKRNEAQINVDKGFALFSAESDLRNEFVAATWFTLHRHQIETWANAVDQEVLGRPLREVVKEFQSYREVANEFGNPPQVTQPNTQTSSEFVSQSIEQGTEKLSNGIRELLSSPKAGDSEAKPLHIKTVDAELENFPGEAPETPFYTRIEFKNGKLIAAATSIAIAVIVFLGFQLINSQLKNPLEENTIQHIAFERAKEYRKQRKHDEHFQKLKEANKEHYAPARAALATAYFAGIGTFADPKVALDAATSAIEHLDLIELSKSGDADAVYQLALLYRDGLAVEKSESKYLELVSEAAVMGHTRAAFHVGRYFYDSDNKIERCRGEEFTQQAADNGEIEAAHWLAWYHKTGKCGEIDEHKAREAFIVAAEGGHPRSQLELGRIYENGWGVENVSFQDAATWYQKAAEGGSAQAQFNLGWLYESKKIYVASPYKEAMKWYLMAAEQEYASAQNNIGALYELGRGTEINYDKAIEWYGRAANQNHHRAQKNLADLFQNLRSDDDEFPDYAKAIHWYEKAAKGSFVSAQIELAIMYRDGIGLEEPDLAKALYWFGEAAKVGNPEAFVYLGLMHEEGYGVTQSYEVAFDYYEQAASQEYSYSYSFLGSLYQRGLGVDLNLEKAIEFYEKGAKKNERNSLYKLAILYLYQHPDPNKSVEAISMLQQASDQANGYAMVALAEIYALGLFGVQPNFDKVFELLPNSTNAETLPIMYLEFAQLILVQGEMEGKKAGARRLFEAAISLGNEDAMLSYAWVLRSGQLGQDLDKAEQLFTHAAGEGQNNAYAGMGLIQLDRGSDGSLSDAYEFCQVASQEGEQCGDYCVGLVFFRQFQVGRRLVQNDQAEASLKRSAEQGNTCSMMLLGLGYELEYFDSKTPLNDAEYWLRKAVENGNLDAGFNLGAFLIRQRAQTFESGFEAHSLIQDAADAGHKASLCAFVAYQATKDRTDINLYELSGYLAELDKKEVVSPEQVNMILQDPRTASELEAFGQISAKTFVHPDLLGSKQHGDLSIVE